LVAEHEIVHTKALQAQLQLFGAACVLDGMEEKIAKIEGAEPANF
jgi:hypothetical protein